MAGDAEPKRGYRTIFRSISQVFYANGKNTSSNNVNYSNTSHSNNTNNNERLQMDNNNSLTVTLTSVTKSPSISTSTSSASNTPSVTPTTENIAGKCIECQDQSTARLRASSMLDLSSNSHQSTLRIVPVTDILRAQQIQEDSEVQQTQQTVILQRFKSASIGDLVDLPGEDDKKSIKNRMRMKFAVNSNVFRINRSPKSEKKSRTRRGQVNSLYLDEQSKYPLFGAPLNALELNMSDHPNVPRFVVDVCAYIERPDCVEQDGLYRASGNKVLVDELKKKLTHLYDPRFLHTDDIHTLTSLHKQFFRELSAPLITQEAYERLGRSLSDDAAIERMRLAFDEMPEPNRSTLRFLIKHLTRVAAASASNRMPSTNLAIVWGPCLLSANQIQLDIGRMNMLAKVLIENHDRIFQPDNERLVC
ncbi:rho GTPase-activating protein 15 isoform X3 [Drosophila subobscura]|uniref:rho GTPase-activating protein 15 isoform X3 n=1 Tax=Drosophila subobscura TaxID=7241 RepID=UPI00155AD4F2|nr:rho GTPase-activating protein 15 isoform X3 [Drosophila subobscura]